jgi:hypothetical protein
MAIPAFLPKQNPQLPLRGPSPALRIAQRPTSPDVAWSSARVGVDLRAQLTVVVDICVAGTDAPAHLSQGVAAASLDEDRRNQVSLSTVSPCVLQLPRHLVSNLMILLRAMSAMQAIF